MRGAAHTRVGWTALSGALALVLAVPLRAQAPAPGGVIPEAEDFVHDGSVGEWRARPIDRVLPATGRVPQALIWVGRAAEGLVVAAEIRSGLSAARDPALRIGLAGPDSLRLPPIGWGHQFGTEVLADTSGCAGLDGVGGDVEACHAWLRRQRRHRARLPLLFEREWRVPVDRPEEVTEIRARSAFAAFPAAVRSRLRPLAPRGTPLAHTRPIAGTEGGVGLEVLIPWGSFPPVPAPSLAGARLRVEWVDPHAPEEPGSWIATVAPRPFARPLEHVITPCRYGLEGLFIPGGEDRFERPAGEGAVPYMIPEASGDLRSLIVLDNEAAGYQYAPDPGGISPAAYELRYAVLDVGRGERLCAPLLALAREGARISPPDWTSSGHGDPFELEVDLRRLETRRLDDGDLLVKSGPRVRWSYYGSGQCGACPRVGVDLYRLSAETGVAVSLFHVLEIAEPGTRDVEIEVSDDWGTVTVYRSVTNWDADPPAVRWDATRHCRPSPEPAEESGGFEPCGEETDVPEPPRRLRSRYEVDP